MNIKNLLLVITMTTAATSMQAMQQGAGAPQGLAGVGFAAGQAMQQGAGVGQVMQAMQQAFDAATAAEMSLDLLVVPVDEERDRLRASIQFAQLAMHVEEMQASLQAAGIAPAVFFARVIAPVKDAVTAAALKGYNALRYQVLINDAIEKTMKLMAASDNEPLSEEEQMKAYTVEVLPLLALYAEQGGLVKEFKHSEESKKNAEEVALEISKGTTAKTFRALFATYLAKGDRRLGVTAELGAVLAGLERPCKA